MSEAVARTAHKVVLGVVMLMAQELRSARPEDLEEVGMGQLPQLVVSMRGEDVKVRRVATFGGLDTGEDGAIVDSAGALAIVRNGGSAAEAWGLEPGDDVLIQRPR